VNADIVRLVGALPTDATAWLMLCLVCIVITAVLAFLAGIQFAGGVRRRALQRAKRNLEKLYAHVVRSLDDARQACSALQTCFSQQLSPAQRERLEIRQSQLVQTIHDILAPPDDAQTGPAPIPPHQQIPEIDWVRSPEDSITKLPDREAFEANFERLCEAAENEGWTSGLLLAKIDKFDQLDVRFGTVGVQDFSRKTARLICRALPERGLAAQWSPGAFAVLLPGMNLPQAKAAAHAIRQEVRRSRFRLNQSDGNGGPEVLVTSSFGLTLFTPDETLPDALNRAEAAVTRSQQCGRNQLHIEDGRRMELCPASGASVV